MSEFWREDTDAEACGEFCPLRSGSVFPFPYLRQMMQFIIFPRSSAFQQLLFELPVALDFAWKSWFVVTGFDVGH